MNEPISFVSTRGDSDPVSFSEAMVQGLAPDGGLYIPDSIPRIDFVGIRRDTYADFAVKVLAHWVTDRRISDYLPDICEQAFNFPVRIKPLKGGPWSDCHVLELFHGPTHSFKDFGARFMARALGRTPVLDDETITILVATSGDTGSAVADGFAGQKRIRVVLLYPGGQVSPTQERQLIVRRTGVRAFRVDGTFDDCQKMVKGVLASDSVFPTRLTTANSINIGRLLPQTIYYSWASAMLDGPGIISVPSGNLGNLTAGILASRSGMRVHRFIASHNANSFFPEFLVDPATAFRPSRRTISNAMDVGAPSNFERLESLLERKDMTQLIDGYSVTDTETLKSIGDVYRETGYLADPHTAVGLEGIRRYRIATGDDRPALVLATAHPAKFANVVQEAIGVQPDVPQSMAALEHMEISVRELQATQNALEAVLRAAE